MESLSSGLSVVSGESLGGSGQVEYVLVRFVLLFNDIGGYKYEGKLVKTH